MYSDIDRSEFTHFTDALTDIALDYASTHMLTPGPYQSDIPGGGG